MFSIPSTATPPFRNTGLIGGLQGVAGGLTSPFGAVRKGLFDFMGMDPNKKRTPQPMSAPDMSGAQAAPMNNPAQNQQVLAMYNQMMNALRQKRGF